jgi:DNA invertase Pin-like site-specific DNA recombinase
MKRTVLYLRVSTVDQTTANQERELREIAGRMGCEIVKVYKDHGISGAKGRDGRPAFDALCRDAAKRQFDVVMAWSVDRLGRSLQDLVAFLSELHALKIDLYLHQQGIDHDAGRQGTIPDDGRICRVRAVDDSGTSPRWP